MSTVTSAALHGIETRFVTLEASPLSRPATILITGPDGQDMHEARDRIRAATVNSGLSFSPRVQVTLSPPDVGVLSSSTDLAIAAAVLSQAGYLLSAVGSDVVVIGELGLDGAVRPVQGVLAIAAAASATGATSIVVPAANVLEAGLISDIQVVGVSSLPEFLAWATHGRFVAPPAPDVLEQPRPGLGRDLPGTVNPTHLPGLRPGVRFGLEVAAAGGHNLGIAAPPGSPALMLGRILPALLPDLSVDEAIEVSILHSAEGLFAPADGLIRRPPLQTPHQSASVASVLGGRRPGAISLAHCGVLLLEDAPEFSLHLLQALRRPVEDGRVQLARADGVVTYPAAAQLVLTSSSCPSWRDAGCSLATRRRYQSQAASVSSLLDVRIASAAEDATNAGESAAGVAGRVSAARTAAADRWAGFGHRTNQAVPFRQLESKPLRLPSATTAALRRAVDTGVLTGSGFARVLRIAWTISDLQGTGRPDPESLDTAMRLYLGEL